ncbi:CRACD-like protein [Tiliqua scincoides]|uniref:CRACD-like protein n=1 Tax=Tiliqua scincoides TaxID=71010 RepID=UPI003462B35E
MSSIRAMDTKVQETEGFGEESSGKKKSKFKTFKKFFGKRKRKETLSSESGSLKLCQSTSDVTASLSMHIDDDSEDELEIRTNMGSRALSHDSIFISEAAQEPARPSRVFSQENVSNRIRALQLKLQQNWKLGVSSPFGTPSKRVDDAGMSSEDDGLPRSPPETSLLQEILNSSTAKFSDSHKHLSSLSLAGTGSEEEEQVTSNPLRSCSTESQLFPKQSSAKIVALQTADNSLSPPADFDAPPDFSACLNNSAAKHKLLVKPRNQRSSRIRRPPLRNLPEPQNYLSSGHEEDEPERKEMPDKLTYESNFFSHQEVTENSNNAMYVKQTKIAKGIQHNLDHQNEKTCTLHSASELDLPPYKNNSDNCKTVQKLLHMISSSSGPKEDIVTLNLTPEEESQREKPQAEALKISPGNLSGMSLSILSQEEKPIHDVPSKDDILPDDSAKNDCLPSLDGTDKVALKDAKALVEDICNKGSSSLPNSSNLLPKSPSQLRNVSYSENSNASQTSWAAPPSQTDRPSLILDKMKPTDELPVSNKEDSHQALPGVLILGVETAKEASELSPLRKFSVSSARERPRTSSVNMRETVCESPLSRQVLQTKIKDFSRNEVKEDIKVSTFQEKNNSTNKQASPSEPEVADRTLDRPMIDTLTQTVSSKPVLSNSSTGLPQQLSAGQSGGEEKNPFQVKLRSTSLSVKYKDNSSQESKEIKRYSAEFNLEKKELASSLPKSEKAEIKKTADIGGFLNENLRTKTKSAEQSSTKPPLPRKPVLQHFLIAGSNTCPEKQEKAIKYPELKNEDPVLEKKQSPSEVPEKSVPPPVIAADTARETESQTMPAWITIAKQKQKVMEQELSREEKPVAQDKADAEKQIREEEKVEEPVRQQTDFARNAFLPFPPTVASEEQKKDTKSDLQESLPKAGLLSHHSSAQSSVPVDKEDIKPLKKVVHSSSDQPSWMELAKKKSQAWSDMPQMIK